MKKTKLEQLYIKRDNLTKELDEVETQIKNELFDELTKISKDKNISTFDLLKALENR